ncbi:11881_t:CDS:2, partial [Diversispora eburnea]
SIELEKDNIDYLRPMMEQLTKNYNVELRDGFYITNIVTGECPLCLDYIWNSSFRDICKHCHAARIFSMAQMNNSNIVQETKEKFVSYFKNKERIVPPDQKNNTIYLGSIDEAYNEIIRLFNIEGTKIFNSSAKQINVCTNPFRPLELNHHHSTRTGSSAKPRKPSRILRYNINNNNPEILSKKSKKNSIMTLQNIDSQQSRTVDLSFITQQTNNNFSELDIVDSEFTIKELKQINNNSFELTQSTTQEPEQANNNSFELSQANNNFEFFISSKLSQANNNFGSIISSELQFEQVNNNFSESTIISSELQFTNQESNELEFARKLHSARQYVLNIINN